MLRVHRTAGTTFRFGPPGKRPIASLSRATSVMDWHGILETTFAAMFFVGLVMTVVMGIMSGAFHSEVAAGSSFEGGIAHDLGGPHIETGMSHAGHPDVGWSHGELPGFSPWSPTVICAALTGAGGI